MKEKLATIIIWASAIIVGYGTWHMGKGFWFRFWGYSSFWLTWFALFYLFTHINFIEKDNQKMGTSAKVILVSAIIFVGIGFVFFLE